MKSNRKRASVSQSPIFEEGSKNGHEQVSTQRAKYNAPERILGRPPRERTGFFYKLRDCCRGLQYAFQRAWNGYDRADVYDAGARTIERLADTMQEFYIGHRTQILAPEVDEAARNIYSNLSYYDTDRALKELFPAAEDYTGEQRAEAHALEDEKIREAFALFGEFYQRFWF